MGLETGTYIDSLVATNPVGSDAKSQGDDHLRLIKSTLLATFPNIDGAMTATEDELNKLDGATVSTTEINYLDIATLGTGVAQKAVVPDGSGNYTWPVGGTLEYDILSDGTTVITATGAELNYLDIATLGTGAASKAVVLDGSGDYSAPAGSNITVDTLTYSTLNDGSNNITATAAELNKLDGATVSTAEINYLSGVSSGIQAQLNLKAPLASPALTGTPTAPTAAGGTSTTQIATCAFVVATALSSSLPGQSGNAGKYLTTDGSNASWDYAVITDKETFTASGTWTKPAGARWVRVECIGGGGGGSNSTSGSSQPNGGGGGGGGYSCQVFLASELGSTETVTIGAGASGGATGAINSGGDGGDSTFGSHLTGPGGLGAHASSTISDGGPGGGGEMGGVWSDATFGRGGYSSGGGGVVNGDGGNSVMGGAGGGGGNGGAGGTSVNGGDGGAGNSAGAPGNGTAPGGGGGGAYNDNGGGDGADGQIIVWSW